MRPLFSYAPFPVAQSMLAGYGDADPQDAQRVFLGKLHNVSQQFRPTIRYSLPTTRDLCPWIIQGCT